jgi:nucleotide-binding universal stress UspA family protein
MGLMEKSKPDRHLLQQPRPQIKRILVPTNFSADSVEALREAAVLAQQCEAVITVLHVVDLNLHTPPTGPANAEQLKRDLWKEALQKLDEAMLELDEGTEVQAMIVTGVPAEEIIGAADRHDLIVIGKNRRKRLWNLFSRRTVEGVLESAPCPVLVVDHRASSKAGGDRSW